MIKQFNQIIIVTTRQQTFLCALNVSWNTVVNRIDGSKVKLFQRIFFRAQFGQLSNQKSVRRFTSYAYFITNVLGNGSGTVFNVVDLALNIV